MLAEAQDRLAELLAFARGLLREEPVEPLLELARVACQGGVGEAVLSSSDPAGILEELSEPRGEHEVSRVDRILSVADQVSEADLLALLRPAHLGGEPVGVSLPAQFSP